MKLIDSHAHLSSPECAPQAELLVAEARQEGVEHIINICTDPLSLEIGLQLAQCSPYVSNVGSTTPHDVEKEGESCFELFAKAAQEGQLIAIGETGLDYFYYRGSKELQIHFLKRYLDLARECHLPVVIHCRDAFADLLSVLDSCYLHKKGSLPGILHCFTGTMSEAQALLERGWYLSFSGIVTYKKSIELQQIAQQVPLDRMLIETDTPYLSPTPHRGKPNRPLYLPATAEAIARLRSITTAELAQATYANTLRAFGLIAPSH